MKAYLIDIASLKRKGYVHANAEDSILKTILIRVQDTMLEPILGGRFYKRLQQGVIDGDLNQDENDLITSYISDFLVSAVDFRAVNAINWEIRSQGTGKSKDEYIDTVDKDTAIFVKKDLGNDVEYYRKKLIGHLRDNREKFPTYNDYICSFEDSRPDKGVPKKQIYFG